MPSPGQDHFTVALRRRATWQATKDHIGDPTSALYTQMESPPARRRFLQVAILLTPHENFSRQLSGVTKRCKAALPSVRGRTLGDPLPSGAGEPALSGRSSPECLRR